MTDREAMLKLISMVCDLNNNVSILVDNIGVQITTASLIRKAADDINDDLRKLNNHYQQSKEPR